MNNQYNVLIDFASCLLVGSILAAEKKRKTPDSLGSKLLSDLMLCCVLVFLADIPGLLLDGKTFSGARILLWVADSAYWILQVVYCFQWLVFTDFWVYSDRERLKRKRTIYALPMLLEILLILINPFSGWVFVLDDANVYMRGSLYLWNMIPYVIYILASLGVLAGSCRKSADSGRRRRNVALLAYMILPVCGVLFDVFVYGISWVWPMVALSLLMVYLNVQQQNLAEEQLAAAGLKSALIEKQLAAAKLESELTEGRVAMMLSQIQPHFLYNALNTVDALCDVDPKEAQKAVRSFAKYLRGNLDALSRKTPVPFRDELSHLRQYLTLESFRFDKIHVDYDLAVLDFMLPPLTLQPIVENAVKYGVLKRKNGGVITISTRERKNYIQLTVEDNGMGFDPSAPQDDRRSHVGISNVRSRLESMCGGTLTVESMPNVGTIVTFLIPKGGPKDESSCS